MAQVPQGYWVIGVDEVGRGALAGPLVAGCVAVWSPSPLCSEISSLLHASPVASPAVSPLAPLAPSVESHEGLLMRPVTWSSSWPKVDDSKRLTPLERLRVVEVLRSPQAWAVHRVCWSLGWVSVQVIDQHNIRKATVMAMMRALGMLKSVMTRLNGVDVFSRAILRVDGIDGERIGWTNSQGHWVGGSSVVGGDRKEWPIAAGSIIAKAARDRLMVKLHQRDQRYGFDQHKGYGTSAHRAALTTYGSSTRHRALFVRAWSAVNTMNAMNAMNTADAADAANTVAAVETVREQ